MKTKKLDLMLDAYLYVGPGVIGVASVALAFTGTGIDPSSAVVNIAALGLMWMIAKHRDRERTKEFGQALLGSLMDEDGGRQWAQSVAASLRDLQSQQNVKYSTVLNMLQSGHLKSDDVLGALQLIQSKRPSGGHSGQAGSVGQAGGAGVVWGHGGAGGGGVGGSPSYMKSLNPQEVEEMRQALMQPSPITWKP